MIDIGYCVAFVNNPAVIQRVGFSFYQKLVISFQYKNLAAENGLQK